MRGRLGGRGRGRRRCGRRWGESASATPQAGSAGSRQAPAACRPPTSQLTAGRIVRRVRRRGYLRRPLAVRAVRVVVARRRRDRGRPRGPCTSGDCGTSARSRSPSCSPWKPSDRWPVFVRRGELRRALVGGVACRRHCDRNATGRPSAAGARALKERHKHGPREVHTLFMLKVISTTECKYSYCHPSTGLISCP